MDFFSFMGPYGPLILLLLLASMLVQGYLSSTYGKFSRIRNARNLTGAQVARMILDENGLSHVPVEMVPGSLTDHYDPIRKVVRLSETNYGVPSLAAAAVAAHEVGHAIQDKVRMPALVLRAQLATPLMIGANFGPILVLAGLLLQFSGLLWLGVILFAGAVLFHLITLPVEFDASRRALQNLAGRGYLSRGEVDGARSVLTAAALTYIAAFAIALAQLLNLLALANGRRSD
ncbi:zinc metallopeptidase [Deinococcus pimensis]|uniref:zinc metallopeptidase n=1 Tax=Deinococcus pimensis TaxID=309888 RepID=UPI00048885FE|nr:zinc metallopeptidase [Deinococcus pimensis]